MGRRGPRPQPTKLRLLRGNASHRPVNGDEPEIRPPSETTAPADLTGAGKEEWNRLVVELVGSGLLTMADMMIFQLYCQAVGEIETYQRMATEAGPELAIAKGYQGMLVKLRAQAKAFAAELGLSPASRSSVKRAEKKPPSKLDRFTRDA